MANDKVVLNDGDVNDAEKFRSIPLEQLFLVPISKELVQKNEKVYIFDDRAEEIRKRILDLFYSIREKYAQNQSNDSALIDIPLTAEWLLRNGYTKEDDRSALFSKIPKKGGAQIFQSTNLDDTDNDLSIYFYENWNKKLDDAIRTYKENRQNVCNAVEKCITPKKNVSAESLTVTSDLVGKQVFAQLKGYKANSTHLLRSDACTENGVNVIQFEIKSETKKESRVTLIKNKDGHRNYILDSNRFADDKNLKFSFAFSSFSTGKWTRYKVKVELSPNGSLQLLEYKIGNEKHRSDSQHFNANSIDWSGCRVSICSVSLKKAIENGYWNHIDLGKEKIEHPLQLTHQTQKPKSKGFGNNYRNVTDSQLYSNQKFDNEVNSGEKVLKSQSKISSRESDKSFSKPAVRDTVNNQVEKMKDIGKPNNVLAEQHKSKESGTSPETAEKSYNVRLNSSDQKATINSSNNEDTLINTDAPKYSHNITKNTKRTETDNLRNFSSLKNSGAGDQLSNQRLNEKSEESITAPGIRVEFNKDQKPANIGSEKQEIIKPGSSAAQEQPSSTMIEMEDKSDFMQTANYDHSPQIPPPQVANSSHAFAAQQKQSDAFNVTAELKKILKDNFNLQVQDGITISELTEALDKTYRENIRNEYKKSNGVLDFEKTEHLKKFNSERTKAMNMLEQLENSDEKDSVSKLLNVDNKRYYQFYYSEPDFSEEEGYQPLQENAFRLSPAQQVEINTSEKDDLESEKQTDWDITQPFKDERDTSEKLANHFSNATEENNLNSARTNAWSDLDYYESKYDIQGSSDHERIDSEDEFEMDSDMDSDDEPDSNTIYTQHVPNSNKKGSRIPKLLDNWKDFIPQNKELENANFPKRRSIYLSQDSGIELPSKQPSKIPRPILKEKNTQSQNESTSAGTNSLTSSTISTDSGISSNYPSGIRYTGFEFGENLNSKKNIQNKLEDAIKEVSLLIKALGDYKKLSNKDPQKGYLRGTLSSKNKQQAQNQDAHIKKELGEIKQKLQNINQKSRKASARKSLSQDEIEITEKAIKAFDKLTKDQKGFIEIVIDFLSNKSDKSTLNDTEQQDLQVIKYRIVDNLHQLPEKKESPHTTLYHAMHQELRGPGRTASFTRGKTIK